MWILGSCFWYKWALTCLHSVKSGLDIMLWQRGSDACDNGWHLMRTIVPLILWRLPRLCLHWTQPLVSLHFIWMQLLVGLHFKWNATLIGMCLQLKYASHLGPCLAHGMRPLGLLLSIGTELSFRLASSSWNAVLSLASDSWNTALIYVRFLKWCPLVHVWHLEWDSDLGSHLELGAAKG